MDESFSRGWACMGREEAMELLTPADALPCRAIERGEHLV
jgi:hypothetical protein